MKRQIIACGNDDGTISNVSLWNNTSNKIHVQGYYRKDGTYVKAYTREK